MGGGLAVFVLFEVRVTPHTFVEPTGTLNRWESLSTERSWSVSTGTGGLLVKFLVDIREIATSEVQASAVVTLKLSTNYVEH